MQAMELSPAVADICIEQAVNNPLAQYQGRNRVVVVLAPERMEGDVSDQLHLFHRNRYALQQRDVVVLTAVGNQAPALRDHFRLLCDIGPQEYAVVLVGKDGGIKMQRSSPVSATELIQTIDAMPLRLHEMAG